MIDNDDDNNDNDDNNDCVHSTVLCTSFYTSSNLTHFNELLSMRHLYDDDDDDVIDDDSSRRLLS